MRCGLLFVSVVAPMLAACAQPARDPKRHLTDDKTGTGGSHDVVGVGVGDDKLEPCDAGNDPPQAPEIITPFQGAIVGADELVIRVTPFTDDDSRQHHRATRYEIFRGPTRAWSFETTDPAKLTSATLADGVFDADPLDDFKDYVIRVSFEDSSGACNDWSAPSTDRAFKTDDGSTALFDESHIKTFAIDMPQSTIDAINNEAAPPGCVQYSRQSFPGTFTSFDGTVFDNVGVSNKGGCGSARNLDGKASFKVKLTWQDPSLDGQTCPASRKLLGQKELTFNNDVQDHSFMHERMGYRLYRAAGVPAPRTATVNLVVNGALWGVYTEVESVGRRFLQRRFDDADGMMFEGAYWCDLLAQNIPVDPGDFTSFTCFDREFSGGACSSPSPDAADWSLLQQLASQIASVPQGPGWYDAMNQFFDVDEFISMWSVDSTLSHWDAYSFHIINNYRVYHDPEDGRWRIIPWGIDQTWGTGDSDVDPFSSDTVLVNGCLSDPVCTAKFANRLHEVVDLFEQLDFPTEAQSIHDQIAADVYADPRKEIDNNGWENEFAALQAWIAQRPAQVRQHLADHGFP